MNKRIKFGIISIVSMLIVGISLYLMIDFQKDEIIIALEEGTELLFFPSGKTSKEVLQEFHCNTVINGSYFGGQETDTFYPAGIWYDNGEKAYTRENRPVDINLTNTIIFEQKSSQAEFIFDKNFAEAKSGSIVFNSGPRLIQNSNKNPHIEHFISHWGLQVPRTILAKKDENQIFLVVFKKGKTLSESALWLIKNGFKDAINLDGGPSTSIAYKNWRKSDFNANSKLPIFFCIK